MKKSSNNYTIYGRHACEAALLNESREILQVYVTANMQKDVQPYIRNAGCSVVDAKGMAKIVPSDAVHQGIAMQVRPLEEKNLDDMLATEKPLVMLDQVTDPHNVGAILRSASAFGAAGVIVHERNAPKENGVIAKAACGALERVPLVRVGNIASALQECQRSDYWCIGFDGEARTSLPDTKLSRKSVLVFGAEGAGLRRLTSERCDQLVKLPISDEMESLNVSNACAIGLYVLQEQTGS